MNDIEPESQTSSPSPSASQQAEPEADQPFELHDALAYVEIDRFCPKCSYNLRGQAVRQEKHTELALSKCPECGAFTPANDGATALNPWLKRLVFLGVGAYALTCVSLVLISIFVQVGISASTISELGWIEGDYNSSYRHSIPGPDDGVLVHPANNIEPHQLQEWYLLRYAVPVCIFLLGALVVSSWTVLVPHWERWAYMVLAAVLPVIAFVILLYARSDGAFRRGHDDVDWLLGLHLFANLIGSMLGCYIVRPCARLAVRALLVPRLRTGFTYLWVVDGKEPGWVKV